jgi:hypothetical protein
MYLLKIARHAKTGSMMSTENIILVDIKVNDRNNLPSSNLAGGRFLFYFRGFNIYALFRKLLLPGNPD